VLDRPGARGRLCSRSYTGEVEALRPHPLEGSATAGRGGRQVNGAGPVCRKTPAAQFPRRGRPSSCPWQGSGTLAIDDRRPTRPRTGPSAARGKRVVFVGEVGGTPLEACILRLSAWPH
jgi:hypothetical protein